MQDELVAIKGIKDGLLIALNETENWQDVIDDLATRLDGQAAFFAGAKITVDLGSRPVPRYALTSLKAALERRGLTLSIVLSDSNTTLESAQQLDIRTTSAVNTPGREANETLEVNPEEVGLPGVLIRRTLRSGRVVRSEGHVVVIGDVNPGAQIIAQGDVIVWGVLRGNVHAGISGDENAVVAALDMIPTQLHIAQYQLTQPKPTKRRKSRPEIALVRDARIMIDAWDQR